jgi:DNA-binding CsgD family transcriptional regulator
MKITAHGFTGTLGMGLAPRELQCLLSVAAGLTSKETARELGVSPDTVDKRLLSATTKLGVTRRAALVAEGFKRGLIAFACNMVPGQEPHQEHDSTQDVLVA